MLFAYFEEPNSVRSNFKRYETFWERDASLPERVAVAWEKAGHKFSLGDIRSGLAKLMVELHAWSKEKFGNITKELEKSRTQLEELMRMNVNRNDIRKVSDHMQELLYREEMLWMQRSWIDWLREGDRNTNFFSEQSSMEGMQKQGEKAD